MPNVRIHDPKSPALTAEPNVSTRPAEAPDYAAMPRVQIEKALDERGVAYTAETRKADLIALLTDG